MGPRKITLWRIANHDFNRAVRAWRSQLSPKEILMLLAQQRARAITVSIRSLALATAGTFWLLANKSELSLRVALVELSIPASYVNFVVATLLMTTITYGISYFILNEFVRVASIRLFKFDSPWALTAIFDGASAWSNAIVPQWRFLTSSNAHKRLGTATLLLVNLPTLAIAAVSFITVVLVGWRVITHEGLLTFGGTPAASASNREQTGRRRPPTVRATA